MRPSRRRSTADDPRHPAPAHRTEPRLTPDTPVIVTPGHLAGPGDPDTAFHEFFEENETWQRWRPRDETTLALHEQQTARIELDHEADGDQPRWTIAAYTSPVGGLHWQARFCARTPVEVVMAVADQLTSSLDHHPDARHDALLWEGRPRDAAVHFALQDADPPWRETGLGNRFTRADGTGGIHLPVQVTGSAVTVPGAVVWGGPRGYDHLRWQAEFTPRCPNSIVVAALNEIIDPQAAERLRGQVPAAHLPQVRIGARPARPAAATAHGQHRPASSPLPAPASLDPAPPGGERRRG
ncbi:DUF317 domain-containing protein [Kitasatospora phosalacinea]|uniref:DUF317 domain-containing protein n=1 Tax=Kitasatospora phosalacinea TaxID=2065 RepID=UPI00364CB043